MHVGLANGQGNGDKDLQEIADLEDECVVKLNDMTYDNQRRKNVPLSTQQARYQSNTLDRIHSQLARSGVGPALLYQIERKNKETG